MLKKLIRHEINATKRIILPMYLILAAMTIVCFILGIIDIQIPLVKAIPSIVFAFYIITLIAVLFGSAAIAVVRFYKSMLTGEGYLTFTLPVKTSSLIISKFVVGFTFTLISVVLILLSLWAVLYSYWDLNLPELFREGVALAFKDTSFALIVAICIVFVIISLAYSQLTFYLSIAIGQNISSNKILGSVAGYLILYFTTEIILLAIMLIAALCIGFDNIETFLESTSGMAALFIGSSAIMLIICFISGYFTNRIFTRRLNLD